MGTVESDKKSENDENSGKGGRALFEWTAQVITENLSEIERCSSLVSPIQV
jgi:hypothetical protein